MAVKRIVHNIHSQSPSALSSFYAELFDLEIAMDMGWIVTLKGSGAPMPLLSLASEGGNGTPVPQLSIEVDDLDKVYAKAQARGASIPYPLTQEPWGVRRFYVQDPIGTLLNVLEHSS